MNELERLKTAKPGDFFWLGFGPNPEVESERYMVISRRRLPKAQRNWLRLHLSRSVPGLDVVLTIFAPGGQS